jgi:hypothetical protein
MGKKNNLLKLLQSKHLPYKAIPRYPYQLSESSRHWSIPGTNIPNIRNVILFTILYESIMIEYYTTDLKVDSAKLLAVSEILNAKNSNSILKTALCVNSCALRVTANIWMDPNWGDVEQQGVILVCIRVFTGLLKGCAHDLLRICKEMGPRPISEICEAPKSNRLPQSAIFCLEKLLQGKEAKLTAKDNSLSAEFTQTYTEESSLVEYLCTVQLTPKFAVFRLSSHVVNALTQKIVLSHICMISQMLSVSSVEVNQQTRTVEVLSKIRHDLLHPDELTKVFTTAYAATLDEFKTFKRKADQVTAMHFEGATKFIAMNDTCEKVIEYSDDDFSSEEEQAIVFTHFKCYDSTLEVTQEQPVIERLVQAGLQQNFGLTDNSWSPELTSSLTFHTPNCDALEDIGKSTADSELTTIVTHLEQFLVALRGVGLVFKDLSKQRLYWNKSQAAAKSTGINVFCNSFLFEMLEVIDSDTKVDVNLQIQNYLRSKLTLPTPAEHPEDTDDTEDLAEVRINVQIEEKFYVTPIDGVKQAVINCRDVSSLTTLEIKRLCEVSYRSYQVHRHPYILNCYGYNYQCTRQLLYFAYEHCNSDLHSFITSGHTLANPLKFLREVASAVGYLSSKPPMKVSLSPKRVLLTSKQTPKLMPFHYNESRSKHYTPPYDPESPAWGKFLAYSFGLIVVFVCTGRDVEYTYQTEPKDDVMKRGDPDIRDCGDMQPLLQYCFNSIHPDFKGVLELLSDVRA